VLWAVVFAAAVHARHGGANPISAIAGWRVPQMFGRISYSIYLWHMFVILLVSAALLDGVKGISQFEHAAILIPSALALSTALSWLSFRIIEKPGMELGQRLARRMRAKGAEAVPQSA
jgi:peptidoglycan/LPS O-acetylase OafA/YrhL